MVQTTEQLVRAVDRRLRRGRFVAAWAAWSVALVAVLLALVVAERVLGVLPTGGIPAWSVGVAIGGAFVCALPRALAAPDLPAAARVVDRSAAAADLFLTRVQLENRSGAFAPLVERSADERARKVVAATVDVGQPLPRRRGGVAIGLAALVVAVTSWVPQLDPFGLEEERTERAKQAAQREAKRAELAKRRAELVAKDLEARNTPPVQREIDKLVRAFQSMRRDARSRNDESLSKRRAAIGEQWSKAAANQRKLMPGRASGRQLLGAESMTQREIREGLQRGDTTSLQRELEQLRKLAKKLAEQERKEASGASPGERGADTLRREFEKRLAELSRTLDSAVPGATGLRNAVAGARLSSSKSDELKQAMESLEVGELEVQAFGQQLRDVADLERALDAVRMAQECNGAGKLGQGEGQGDGDGMSLDDYAALYEEILANAGQGNGQGMRGRGMGEGGEAPEAESDDTPFETELSKSALVAGRTLLRWTTRELAVGGDRTEAYGAAVDKVRDGVGEAIVAERIPPGYHEAIRRYFDALNPPAAGQKESAPSTTPPAKDQGK